MSTTQINREKERAQAYVAYWADPEKFRKKGREWRNRNIEACRKNSREWNARNRARCKTTTKIWNQNNRAHVREYERRRRKDPIYRIRKNLSSRLHELLTYLRKKKTGRTITLLGCSIPELKTWLEGKFKDGMSWDNYGYRGWHIDHIRPCSSFDLREPAQQQACFHYTNLRPLWGADNMSKSDRWKPPEVVA